MFSRSILCINRRLSPKTCQLSQDIVSRSMHIACRTGCLAMRICPPRITRYSPALGSSFVRYINTEIETPAQVPFEVVSAPSLLDKIPDAPLPPPPEASELAAAVVGEPTFESLGLGGWTPIGIVQQFLELVHVTCGVPWWGTITIGTICVRTLIFPLVILSQRNAAKLHNVMPGMQKIQLKISDARSTGDNISAARHTQELMLYMKNNECSPFKTALVPLAQAPIFISFFFGLKKMANLPVDSLREGGLFWFKDLTVCDPYYVLPIVTSVTLALTLKLGIEGPKLASMGMFRYVVQAMPLIILPFTMNFPAAIVWYWVSTNIISMIQVFFLRIPRVREFFNIPVQIQHPPDALQKPKKFKEGFQESWSNLKMAREMTDRQQVDRALFNKHGRGPVEKTYDYNPVQKPVTEKISLRKR